MEAFSDLRILGSVVSWPALKIVEGVQLFVLSCGMESINIRCLTCEKLEGGRGGGRDHIIYLPQCNQMFDFFCAEKVFNVDD